MLTTSIPVVNKILGSNIAPPANSEAFYNEWQMPFAMIMGILIGLSQFARYGRNDLRLFLKKISWSVLITLVLSIIIVILMHISKLTSILFILAVVFALLCQIVRGNAVIDKTMR